MPAESSPLFRPNVLRERTASFALSDFFQGLLGYTSPASSGEGYPFKPETYIPAIGKKADAALGRFGDAEARVTVVVACKGPKDPLERPFAGRTKSAADEVYLTSFSLFCDGFIL